MPAPRKSAPKPAAPDGPFERSTRQRRNIRAVFEAADRPLSVDEVLSAAKRGRHKVSLSTVYRFVRSLVDEGWLAVIEMPGLGTFYELAGKAHHHHFSCLACGRVYELNDCVSIREFALPKGFKAVSHDITVAGACAACSASARA
jgi:Fur family transcriptional regulator, ferric uptake regulator